MKMKGLSEPQTNAPPLTTTTNRTTNLPTTYAQTCTHRHKHAHTCRQTVGLCKQNLRMENPSSNLSNFASDEANNALGRDFVNLCSARKLKLYPKLTTCTCVYIPVRVWVCVCNSQLTVGNQVRIFSQSIKTKVSLMKTDWKARVDYSL